MKINTMRAFRLLSIALSLFFFFETPCFFPGKAGALYAAEIDSGKSRADEKKEEQPPPLREGSVVNKSDVEMLVSLVRGNKLSSTFHLMPGQSLIVSKDIVEAKVERAYVSPIPVKYSVLIVMPDGKKHEVKTSRETIRLSLEESK